MTSAGAEPEPVTTQSPERAARRVSRRALVTAGVAGGAVIAVGAAAVASGTVPGPVRRWFADTGTDGVVPDVPQQVTWETVPSTARGRDVGLFTAVPVGVDPEGLPLCLVLHGATATTADYEGFGLGRFLTAAVDAGVPPFALVGADGGRTSWAGDGASDDPQSMLREELPGWAEERGFDTTRVAAYGWSMGGAGALRTALQQPGWLTAVAALSPAVSQSDPVFVDADRIDGSSTAIWCGTADALVDDVRALVAAIPGGPAVAAFSPGAHTRGYWNRVTPDAFAFVGASLR